MDEFRYQPGLAPLRKDRLRVKVLMPQSGYQYQVCRFLPWPRQALGQTQYAC